MAFQVQVKYEKGKGEASDQFYLPFLLYFSCKDVYLTFEWAHLYLRDPK